MADNIDDISDIAKTADKLDDIADAAKAADKVDDISDAAKAADKVDDISDVSNAKTLENGPYIKDGKPNGRPQLSGEKKIEFEKRVYESCLDPDGVLRDPNTREIIDWKPGEPRKGVVDFGHKKGRSYKEMFSKYKNGEITLQELKEFQFNPDNYRLETPKANRSHLYE